MKTVHSGSLQDYLRNVLSSTKKLRKEMPLPEMKKIPVTHYDYSCPICGQVMKEKDFSFTYQPAIDAYWHCDKNKPFRMPNDK
jgi:hypothetical protein